VYENSETPSYFDYKFPINSSIYKLNSKNIWYFLKQVKLNEDEFYHFREEEKFVIKN